MNKLYLSAICVLSTSLLSAQIFFSNGAEIQINDGALVHCNGGVILSQATSFVNDGTLTTTLNSTKNFPGNFELNSLTTVGGDGIYEVEQDWINSATFNSDNSVVRLFGNQEQMITSGNATETEFNILTLLGSGTNDGRKKTLVGVNSSVTALGALELNDRELSTDGHSFTVKNASTAAVTNATSFGGEGFVSSTDNGNLIWNTNQFDEYLFPVGSSEGTRRYRPLMITSNEGDNQRYAVRFNNYSAEEDGFYLTQFDPSIGEVNPLYYHSIENLEGDANADLVFFYVPAEDNEWDSYANWDTASDEWKNAEVMGTETIGNFKSITKNAWDVTTENTSYALINYDYTLIIYDVMSPNGDGKNDSFIIEGLQFYPNSEVWIYNRWGTEVYHTENYQNDWYGTSQSNLNIGGDELPEGTYYYIMRLGGHDGQLGYGDVHKGFIYLKR